MECIESSLESIDPVRTVIIGANVDQCGDAEIDRRRINQRDATHDHTGLFKRTNPAPTWRRGQADGITKLAGTEAPVVLQQTHNFPIKFIHNR